MGIEDLAKRLQQHRGSMGVRAAAREIGISPTTLSRVEHGHVPDLKTLHKISDWMGDDPSLFVGQGVAPIMANEANLQIAFKKKTAVPKQTSQSLARMIQKASQQFTAKIESESH